MGRWFPIWVADPGALGLLALRVVAGVALMLHGYPKIVVANSWMGADTQLPGWVQALSAFTEFVGGAALLVGLLTPIVCTALILNMVYALFVVHIARHDPFVLPEGTTGASYELVLMYIAISAMFLLVGPGIHSVDWHFFHRRVKERETVQERPRATSWR